VFLRDERLVLAANLRCAKIRGALLSIEHVLGGCIYSFIRMGNGVICGQQNRLIVQGAGVGDGAETA
jgi:hypothetical protein